MNILHSASHEARRLVTAEMLASGSRPDISSFAEPVEPPVDLTNLTQLLAEGLQRSGSSALASQGQFDAWLGPRLHASLRLPRRLAADPGVWLHLGLTTGFDYTFTRFGPAPERSRFTGGRDKHALARLWWTTELFRNGPDYEPCLTALRNQDIVNTIVRIDAAHHRPTCLAVARVRKRDNPSAPMTGREANALSTAINCTATTLMLTNLGPDAPTAPDNVASWIAEAGTFNIQDYYDTMPEGPDEERVPDSAIDPLVELFTDVLATAPVRGD